MKIVNNSYKNRMLNLSLEQTILKYISNIDNFEEWL